MTEENLVTTELEYLSGAEFTIYKAIEDENGELTGEKVEIAKITSNEVKNEEGNVIKELGHAIYSGLGAGTYYIKELKAPLGYRLSEQVVKIDINEDGVFADGVSLEEKDGIYSFKYYNSLTPAVPAITNNKV